MRQLLVFLVLISLPRISWPLTTLNHQMQYEVTVVVASNDGGDEFKPAKIALDKNKTTMMKAVIAPDVDQSLWPPIKLHGHEAMLHYNFGGSATQGSQEVAGEYYARAVNKWRKGDMTGALFDLGCVLHLVQDASFCGHSNRLFFPHLGKHSAFEHWVEDQTAPNKKPKSFGELWAEGWAIKSGGLYLKSPWRDKQGKPHWEGSGEAWIDVAAHLSYNHAIYSMGLDYADCEFQGQARMQFVIAQRCGAGLLVDFFRRVGIIPGPETMTAKLKQSNLWPTTSPNGVSSLTLRQNGGRNRIDVTANKSPIGWEFPSVDYPSFPQRIGRAFYLGNYFIGLTDAAEGGNWQHLYLLPAVPRCDSWWTCKEVNQFFFDSPNDLEKYQFQVINLP